jgi:hypothetical protein
MEAEAETFDTRAFTKCYLFFTGGTLCNASSHGILAAVLALTSQLIEELFYARGDLPARQNFYIQSGSNVG